MCSAARGAVRNAKQKKAVPAKNSEAIFWRPRFTWPLRAGKRANANFACSEGFFCVRCAAPSAGAASFAKPAAVWTVGFCARCPGIFLPVFRCLVPGLRAICLFCAGFHARCLFARHVLPCAHFFFCLSPFSASLLPLKILFICRSCRDGHPIFFSERKWGKRTARGCAPSNPIPVPCGRSPPFSGCWPA